MIVIKMIAIRALSASCYNSDLQKFPTTCPPFTTLAGAGGKNISGLADLLRNGEGGPTESAPLLVLSFGGYTLGRPCRLSAYLLKALISTSVIMPFCVWMGPPEGAMKAGGKLLRLKSAR